MLLPTIRQGEQIEAIHRGSPLLLGPLRQRLVLQ
jgi:hypothetical protein